MKSRYKHVILSPLFLAFMLSCGTQIGNPTGAGMIRLTDNTQALNTLVNAGFMQIVDSMNIGDYAYSKEESRVISQRNCSNQSENKLTLTDSTEAAHSVSDDSDEWAVKSDLLIKRNYHDAWTQNHSLLGCDAQSKVLKLDYKRFQQGAFRLESQVDEQFTRKMNMTEKKLKQDLKHSMLMTKKGSRTLELISYLEDGKDSIIEAQLRSQLETTVKLDFNKDGANEAKLSSVDRFPFVFNIHINRDREWTSYDIPNGRQTFLLPETGEVLSLSFLDLRFTRSSGCVPESGQLLASIERPNASPVRYSLIFKPNIPLLLKREDREEYLVFAPFACVLKER